MFHDKITTHAGGKVRPAGIRRTALAPDAISRGSVELRRGPGAGPVGVRMGTEGWRATTADFWKLPFDPGNFDALPGELFDTPADLSGGEECARPRCSYRGRTHGKLVQKGEERCQQHSGCRGRLPALSSGAVCLRSRWTARALVRSSTVRPSRFRSSPDITLCGYGPAGTRAEITPSTWPTTTPSTSAVAEPSSGRGGSCPCSSRIWGSCSSGDDPASAAA